MISEPGDFHGASAPSTARPTAGTTSASSGTPGPSTNIENAASRPGTALGTAAGRDSAPPSSRISTIISGISACGPATASSASTASSGSPVSSWPFSHAGSGSTGSMWMESISSVRMCPTNPSSTRPTSCIGAISRSPSRTEVPL
ncbi:hypothetical protein DQ239_18385 [Blastococcus sp. TF02-09]|nr:hypothetical protein DQ239_18385 [Blastococcus sp. TF02-9]